MKLYPLVGCCLSLLVALAATYSTSAPARAMNAQSTGFATPLELGDTHPEVLRLQQFLNAQGFVIAEEGPGSIGHESDYFGMLTKQAVERFQATHASEILTPAGLSAPTGYWGMSSMRKANAMLQGIGTAALPVNAQETTPPDGVPLTRSEYTDLLRRIEHEAKNRERLSDRVLYDGALDTLSGVTLENPTFESTDADLATLSVSGTATFGSPLELLAGSVPSVTVNKLYNVGGNLYWNGTELTSATSSVWSTLGSDAYRSSGRVGIGTASPAYVLDVIGSIGGYRGLFTNATTEGDATTIGGSGEAIKLWANSGGAELKTASSTRLRINNQVRFDSDNFTINTPALVFRTTTDTDADSSKGAMIEYQQAFTNTPHDWGYATEKYKDGAPQFTPTAGTKRVSWITTHYDSPASTGEDLHQHFNIETAKEDLSTIITRFQISYGEDTALVGFPNSNVQFFDNKNVYFGSDRDVTMKYDTASGLLKILGQTTDSAVETTNDAALALTGTLSTTGSVGIGTSTPERLLHVVGSSGAGVRTTDSTNAVKTEMRADDFQGFMGTISNHDLRLMTNGSSRLTVTTAGYVGVGTSSPAYLFHAVRSGDGDVAAFSDANGTCTINPTNTALVCSSDERLKKDITTIPNALTSLAKLRGVTFHWNHQEDETDRYGFVAQEVEKVFPEFVMADAKGNKMVNMLGFTPVLVEAVNELSVRLDDLEAGQGVSTASTELVATLGDAAQYVFDRLAALGVEVRDGLLKVKRLVADDEVCVGTTCVNEEQLAALLLLLEEGAAPATSSDIEGGLLEVSPGAEQTPISMEPVPGDASQE